MADIVYQQIATSFSGGLNQLIDPKQLPLGNLTEMKDAQFTRQGQLNKRFGYKALGNTVIGGGTISHGVALNIYNDELICCDGYYLYSYIESTDNWANKGPCVSLDITNKDIIRRNDAQQLNPDVAIQSGVEVYAWEGSGAEPHTVNYTVVDANTNNIIVNDAAVTYATAMQPKTIAFNNNIFIFYTDNALAPNAWYQKINPLNPNTIGAQVPVFTDGYAGADVYDVAVIGNRMFVAYYSSATASGQISLFYYDTTLTKSPITVVEATYPNAFATGGGTQTINVIGDASGRVWVTWSDGTNVRTAAYVASTMGLVLADTLVVANVAKRIAAIDNNDTTSIEIIYEVAGTPSSTSFIKGYNMTTAGVSSSVCTLRSVGLASKCFTYSGNNYVNVTFQSALQSTYFTILLSGPKAGTNVALSVPVVIGKELSQIGGGLRTTAILSEVPVTSTTGIFKFANCVKGQILSEANTIFTILGVNSSTLDFVKVGVLMGTEQSNNFHIPGGILKNYDGISVIEHNFHLFPEEVTFVVSGSGSNLSTGQYQYQVVFEFQDAVGLWHRSTPSPIYTQAVTAGQNVQLTIPTLRLTQKSSQAAFPRSDINIVIYRTSANGIVFNQITSDIAPKKNDTTVDTVVFTDVASDAAISSNQFIYTSGNVLSNEAPPASSLICRYQSRLFISGLEDINSCIFSQNKYDYSSFNTVPVNFSAELSVGVDAFGGPITAIGNLNGNLIIFKETSMYLLQGDGPDNTGTSSSFPDPILISADVGCNNPNSVVVVGNLGLMFQSNKGMYQLGPDQSLTFIGAGVANYTGSPASGYSNVVVTSANLLADFNQVIFTTNTGISLVYDYLFQQWYVWTNQYIVDSVNWKSSDVDNVFVCLQQNGKILKMNTDITDPLQFTDAGKPIQMSITLPDLAFQNLSAWQQVGRMFILGTYKGAHSLQINIAYNNNPTYTESKTFTINESNSAYGSGNYGDGYYGGGQYVPYQFKYGFGRKRNTSIRVQINEIQNTSTYNEGFALSGITFDVGVLPGGVRLPATAYFGSRDNE